MSTGIGELDRVLGGGLVPGSLVLLGGSPGIGKSTLTNMVLGHLEQAGHRTLYVSGEESAEQVRLRAERLAPGAMQSICAERPIPEAVNQVVRQLETLSGAFTAFASRLGAQDIGSLWKGSLDSLAGRQLKWVYPDAATSDEFLKRATLLSTLVIDELQQI